ncbi:hypothetical protein ENUP19_0274G0090 [Entamoeba nuttalli]|uniref:Leucine-rich repeat containing protein n=2 Tax=Entamoeba nuttalli TaxID=412467 RepID=K2GFF0_ENTNP|nr:hypothetical protein ENU1_056900 [Entamoeba nuttalli P19]EKE41401.1 hypothetical protein ENU1_056900 [Entamoeba nuttalli P19]|eukprot:XP_008856250.1 hypothetical protein ENU1_056900 [Entamoeba nuttalli P19]
MKVENIHLKQIVQYLKSTDIFSLMCVNKRILNCIRSLDHLPYLPSRFLFTLLSDYSKDVIPVISMDFKNSFIPPKDVKILFRQNTTTPLLPPLMPIRQYIISLNIPIHPKYLIDLTTFPLLTKLTLNIFSQPSELPSLNLKSLFIHLNSENQVSFLSQLTSINAEITHVQIHSPTSESIKEIQRHLPKAVIVTSKISDISLLNKVKCIHNYIPMNGIMYECTSVPASVAFLNGNFITSRLIETAYVYGNLLSIPIAPLTFKELYLINLSLPKRGSLFLRGVEKLVIGSCNNLVGIEGLEKCPLKHFVFCKNSCLASLKMPTTLTYLDASDWKPLTVPPLPLLKTMKIKQCQTFRHITLPPNVEHLFVEGCSKLKRITNLCDIQLISLELIELPELTLGILPSCLKSLFINNIPIFELDLKTLKNLEVVRIGACSDLSNITLNNEIKEVELTNLNSLTTFIYTSHPINKINILMCKSLTSINAWCSEIHISNLLQLKEIKLKECKGIEVISCNILPSFEEYVYDFIILKKVSIKDYLPISKKIILDTVNCSFDSFNFSKQLSDVIKIKNIKKLKSIQLPNSLKKLTLMGIGIETISLPSSLCNFHLLNCGVKVLDIPTQCSKLKIQKCKELTRLDLPSTLTYLKIKKCPTALLISSYLPNIPYELLKKYCVTPIN